MTAVFPFSEYVIELTCFQKMITLNGMVMLFLFAVLLLHYQACKYIICLSIKLKSFH